MIRLALTLGDPRGIGPEIAAKALSDPRIAALGASWHVIGPTGTPVPVHESVGVWTPTGHGVEHINGDPRSPLHPALRGCCVLSVGGTDAA